MATLAFSSMASAVDLPSTTAGLVDGFEGAGEAPLAIVDRPGFKLSHSFRLRMDVSDRLTTVAHGAAPTRTMLLDRSRSRRLGSAIDFYPMDGSGFHLTAGMRKMPRPARRVALGAAGSSAFDLSGLSATPALGARSSIARRSPTVTAGWTGMVAKEMQIGFMAGALQQHGKTLAGDFGGVGGGAAKRWSRIGEVAQVNLQMRF